MKMISFFLFFFTFSFQSHAKFYRPRAKLLNPKAYEVKLENTFNYTQAYYDEEGNEQAMGESITYWRNDLDVSLFYGLDKKLELFSGAKFRYINSENATQSLTKSGAESVWLGGKYSLFNRNGILFVLDAHFRQTLYENKKYALGSVPDEIDLGDGGSEYRFGFDLLYGKETSPYFFNTEVYYVSPPNDLSAEVDYKFEMAYRWREWGVRGGLDGVYSLQGDQYTSYAQKPQIAQGSTRQFNSINREYVRPYLAVDSNFGRWGLSFEAAQIMNGVSTDKAQEIKLALNIASDGETQEQTKIDAFKEYNIEASVVKVSPRGNFIKIDQGLATDVEKGMRFDIYQTDYFGGNVLVAEAVVYEVNADSSVLKLTKIIKQIEIRPGFSARGY